MHVENDVYVLSQCVRQPWSESEAFEERSEDTSRQSAVGGSDGVFKSERGSGAVWLATTASEDPFDLWNAVSEASDQHHMSELISESVFLDSSGNQLQMPSMISDEHVSDELKHNISDVMSNLGCKVSNTAAVSEDPATKSEDPDTKSEDSKAMSEKPDANPDDCKD